MKYLTEVEERNEENEAKRFKAYYLKKKYFLITHIKSIQRDICLSAQIKI